MGQGRVGAMFFFGGFGIVLVALIGLTVLAIVAVATGRGEPDPSGARAYAIYLTSITFLALFVSLVSGYQVVREIAGLGIAEEAGLGGGVDFSGPSSSTDVGFVVCSTDPDGVGEVCHSSDSGFSNEGLGVARTFRIPDADHFHIRQAVKIGAVGLLAAGLLLVHRKRLRELFATEPSPATPAGRIALVYNYVVSFSTALLALGGAAAAAYAIFRVGAPDVSAIGDPDVERDEGIVDLLANGALVVFSWWIFSTHWKRADAMRLGSNPTSPQPE